MSTARFKLVFCLIPFVLGAFSACSEANRDVADQDTSVQTDTVEDTAELSDVSDVADTGDAPDGVDTGDVAIDQPKDTPDVQDVSPDLTPDGPYDEQLIEAGIISDLYASPGGNHFFYLFRETPPGEGSWNVLGGNLGVFHGQNGQTTRYGLSESYHNGWIEKGYTYNDYFYYARDIGAPGADKNLIMATPQSVQQLGYDTAWECMRVFDNGAVAWVDLVGQEPADPFGGGLLKGTPHLRLPDGTLESFQLQQGGCRTDGLSDELGAVLSPDGRYFAFYDYSFYDPDDLDFGSTIDLYLIDLNAPADFPTPITSSFNEPRGPLTFTPDSSRLLFLNQDNAVTAVETANPGNRLSLQADTYPFLDFHVLNDQEILFKGRDMESNEVTVVGNVTSGEETVIRNDTAWSLLTLVDGSSWAYVVTDDRLGLMDWNTGQITDLDDKPARSSSGSALEVRGQRAVYATGNYDDGFTLRTVVPGESPQTVYEDYQLFANGNFQPRVTLDAAGSRAFHLTYREAEDHFDLLATEVPGGESTLMAENVGRFAYHPDVDRMAIVHGGVGAEATYQEGEGLYLLVPTEP